MQQIGQNSAGAKRDVPKISGCTPAAPVLAHSLISNGKNSSQKVKPIHKMGQRSEVLRTFAAINNDDYVKDFLKSK